MIRAAATADLPELMRMAFSLHKAARFARWARFEACVGHYTAAFQRAIADGGCFVAEADGRLVGFAMAHVACAWWGEVPTVQGLAIWVEGEHRRGGIGDELADAVETWGASRAARLSAFSAWQDLAPKPMGAMLRKRGYRRAEVHFLKEMG